MLTLSKKTLLVTSLAALLSACGGDSESELEKKSPKTLYQEAMQHLYAKDAQFNLNASTAIDMGDDNPMLAGLKVNFTGAINNSQQRYELIPTVEAAIFNFKLPLLIDIKKQEVLVDPSNVIDTAAMFLPDAASEFQQYKNKFVRFSVDNFDVPEDDLKEATAAFAEIVEAGAGALNEFSQKIPESSIRKLDLDDKAKQLGAKAVLNVSLNAQQSKELQQHINTYISNKISSSTTFPEEGKEEIIRSLAEASEETGYESSDSVLYLNDKGQIIHESDVFNYEIDGEKMTLAVSVDYSNYGKAVFTINPAKDQIIDFSEDDVADIMGGM